MTAVTRRTLLPLLGLIVLSGAVGALAQTPTLFISEYYDGIGEDNAIEIFNCTGTPVYIGDYFLRIRFKDQRGVMLTLQLSPATCLPHGETWLVADYGASAAVLALADHTASLIDFDGDDAVTLSTFNGSTYDTIDSVGQWDIDPGDFWGYIGGDTQAVTMRRQTAISAGDTDKDDPFDPCLEWDFFAQGDYGNLGFHSAICDGTVDSASETWGSIKALYR